MLTRSKLKFNNDINEKVLTSPITVNFFGRLQKKFFYFLKPLSVTLIFDDDLVTISKERTELFPKVFFTVSPLNPHGKFSPSSIDPIP